MTLACAYVIFVFNVAYSHSNISLKRSVLGLFSCNQLLYTEKSSFGVEIDNWYA